MKIYGMSPKKQGAKRRLFSPDAEGLLTPAAKDFLQKATPTLGERGIYALSVGEGKPTSRVVYISREELNKGIPNIMVIPTVLLFIASIVLTLFAVVSDPKKETDESKKEQVQQKRIIFAVLASLFLLVSFVLFVLLLRKKI